MMEETYFEDEHEVLTSGERIKHLEERVAMYEKGDGPSKALMDIANNPARLKQAFGLTDYQTTNAKAAIAAIAQGLGTKYLGPMFGDKLVGAAIGLGTAMLNEKLFGKSYRGF